MPTFSAAELTEFAAALLARGGIDRQEAELVAQSLVGGNLRGYDSHGVMRIPQYMGLVSKGDIVAGAEFEVLNETPSLLTVDAHWGFGQRQARQFSERLIDKAKTSGVAVGTMIQSSHVGRLGEYCEMAAESGLIGMMMVNNHGAVHRVSPPGGKSSRLSTNPLAVAIPRGDEPIVVDFCTSATAEGKVRVMKMAGQKCPEGWIIDSEGRPTTDPNDLYGDPHGSLRPMGGDQAHKGFGLSLMVDIFCGALSGGRCSREVPSNQVGNGVFMMVFDPAHFGGTEHFASEVSQLVDWVRSSPTVDGVERIILPGEPERETLARKQAEGITLDEGNWSQLVKLADELGVDVPE